MGTKLLICLLLAISFYAEQFIVAAPTTISSNISTTELDNRIHISSENKESISSAATFPTSTSVNRSRPLNVEKELNKIADTCISGKEYEEIYGNTVKRMLAILLASNAFRESVEVIGLEELRKVLKFAPPPPWKMDDDLDFYPSEKILAAAPTIEAYYDLKEPQSIMRVIDNDFLFEHNIKTTIEYFERKFPAIRNIFKHEFEKSAPKVVDRKGVDDMIDKFKEVNGRFEEAFEKLRRNYGCEGKFKRTTSPSTTPATTTHSTPTTTTTSTTPPPPTELENSLKKISTSCFNKTDFEEIKALQTDKWYSPWPTREVLTTIGLQELRSVLKFAPLSPWKHYNETEFGDEGLDSVTNLEAYYNLQEPKSKPRSLDNYYISEKTLHSFIKIFDNRVPEIRSSYRNEMEKIRLAGPPELDKETIDSMINEFGSIDYRVYMAAKELKDEWRWACR